MTTRRLDYAIARQLAVQAHTDPRTILAVHRGRVVRGMAGHRAREALAAAGFLRPDDPTTTTA
jgi:hypothetical protein